MVANVSEYWLYCSLSRFVFHELLCSFLQQQTRLRVELLQVRGFIEGNPIQYLKAVKFRLFDFNNLFVNHLPSFGNVNLSLPPFCDIKDSTQIVEHDLFAFLFCWVHVWPTRHRQRSPELVRQLAFQSTISVSLSNAEEVDRNDNLQQSKSSSGVRHPVFYSFSYFPLELIHFDELYNVLSSFLIQQQLLKYLECPISCFSKLLPLCHFIYAGFPFLKVVHAALRLNSFDNHFFRKKIFLLSSAFGEETLLISFLFWQ